MTVGTDMLVSLDQSPHLAMSSPFSFPQSLPNRPPFDHYLNQQTSSPRSNPYHPVALFDGFKFGTSTDNPEPPITLSTDGRVRSLSASRSINIGKAPSSRARPTRKLSMSEGRPPLTGNPSQRGRSVQSARPPGLGSHPRTMSHSDVLAGRLGLGIGLDTHKEGERTDSITPPDLSMMRTYGVSVSHTLPGNAASWGSGGSAPSLVPGSIGSYGGTNDSAIMDR